MVLGARKHGICIRQSFQQNIFIYLRGIAPILHITRLDLILLLNLVRCGLIGVVQLNRGPLALVAGRHAVRLGLRPCWLGLLVFVDSRGGSPEVVELLVRDLFILVPNFEF